MCSATLKSRARGTGSREKSQSGKLIMRGVVQDPAAPRGHRRALEPFWRHRVALFTKAGVNEDEPEQVDNRILYLRFSYDATKDGKKNCKPSAACGARLYLEGFSDVSASPPPPPSSSAPSSSSSGASSSSSSAPSFFAVKGSVAGRTTSPRTPTHRGGPIAPIVDPIHQPAINPIKVSRGRLLTFQQARETSLS